MATSEERVPVRVATHQNETVRYRKHNVYLTDTLDNAFYEAWNLPSFPESPNDSFREVGAGEDGLRGITLLAYEYYRRPDLWWVIAVANNIELPTRDFKAGMIVRIPARESVFPRLI